ncbi:hypothetical protein GOB94_04050 [Granulicella sp. 5B5]|uniref:hypothetical protein n=1 Tax=Granulicella sp. 5B5 TaxID=1617967 RepID=UPI0015F475B4|nr:hypothetical protein [Granulicella sp. 5B5]QMV17955.1 hypothetical protein GOB94_04050 [Granulicella sp. 5B5]
MLADDFTQVSVVADQAEHELALYLRVVHDYLGLRDPLHSGHLWIDILQSLEWPTRGHEDFFRCVTILAVLQLHHHQADVSITPAHSAFNRWTTINLLSQERIQFDHLQQAKEFTCRN